MIQMEQWKRGFVFYPKSHTDLRMYLWFYEWNLFEAVREGQHTPGKHEPHKHQENNTGTLTHADLGLNLDVQTTETGADLTLTVTNKTAHNWPEIAAIIPCFNPGKNPEVVATETFFDDNHERTYYLGTNGLTPLVRRDIHFNHMYRAQIDAQAQNGQYIFSEKWPTSPDNASGGLLVRESSDKMWVAGIAWESFLSLQGHNPWRCMHQSIRVGPLAPNENRDIRGKIYLLQGTKETVLEQYHTDFAPP